MRIAIDIDGVIRDSVWKMVELYNNYFSTNLQVNDVEFYDVKKSFPLLEEIGMDPYKFFFDDHDMDVNFESYCFDGVIHAIKKAHQRGHSIHLITYQPTLKNKISTIKWLCIMNIIYDSITFVSKKAKNIIDVDVIIDDNPSYFKEVNTNRCILINRSYNKNLQQYGLSSEYVAAKDRELKIERFDSLVNFLKTLPECETKELF